MRLFCVDEEIICASKKVLKKLIIERKVFEPIIHIRRYCSVVERELPKLRMRV